MTLVKMNKQPPVLKKSLYFLGQGHALSWWKHIHTRRATQSSVTLDCPEVGRGGGGGVKLKRRDFWESFFLYIIFIFFPRGG